ncbi:hypothetical protein Q648_00828 [Bartonella quintana JK 12]|uniref:Uncharacterized protein n=1 Tax=Bartonella quintana JK 68 TaxID=1134503 RepID=A0ABR4SRI2_BARQI|nr:hypothetical protein Q651_01324 [Bartonella quintana BQ2-D70]ETS18289.1 hypothetical protein Q647_01239 [Bartonella quintana JK 7]ETS19118.1 hypothetical protein Q648_00828 [Bartonella quintana JK 12]KEC60281.1 hypothetical protein O93_00029 [Bartonella quintana JK 19]KEC60819.1 hypothetical protein O91_01001 [Bartonella quintana JK 31]KEC61462.1 hypothetical protein O7Y_01230 [Bartonella quintana JK 63]KEC63818.1 hypothetical protein O7W_01291 [Bartonella quintana JK 56]KEC66785.1 hypoth
MVLFPNVCVTLSDSFLFQEVILLRVSFSFLGRCLRSNRFVSTALFHSILKIFFEGAAMMNVQIGKDLELVMSLGEV